MNADCTLSGPDQMPCSDIRNRERRSRGQRCVNPPNWKCESLRLPVVVVENRQVNPARGAADESCCRLLPRIAFDRTKGLSLSRHRKQRAIVVSLFRQRATLLVICEPAAIKNHAARDDGRQQ